MKRARDVFLIVICIVLMIAGSVRAGDLMLYEDDDWKIGIDNVTACMLYDIRNDQTLAGTKTSFVQWKKLNLDFGIIGDWDDFTEADLFAGISYDIPIFEFNDHFYFDAGVYGSPGWLDDEEKSFGVYGGLKYQY